MADEFRLYNTMTREVEPFTPADGTTVRMYTCGPTVYNPAHIGNFRTFLFEDLLRRAVRLHGWRVRQVMNLTDVDDKIIRRAAEQGVTIDRITEPVIEIFQKDREYLRIQPAEEYPRATAYIPQMIALVERLVEAGVAYQADDGSVYFAIDRFPRYGKLSRLDRREVKAGARVAQDDYTKENAQDFALWKAAKPEDEATGAAWDSPWGRGRPGWHLECSAMALELLGETLDIHCGGIDLVFPHHEDEIAQSEAATGKPFSHFWCHGAFLLIDEAKMAKRVGNVVTVADLRTQSVPAAAVRHTIFSTHYRKELNFSQDSLEASARSVRRIGEFMERLREARGGTPELAAAAGEAVRAVHAALADDLGAPEALAALHTFINRANAELDRGGSDASSLERAREAFALINGALDVAPLPAAEAEGYVRGAGSAVAAQGEDPELAAWVAGKLADRRAARERRDFGAADAIRKELEERGIEVKDTPQGTKWKVVR